jgi:signal transduction histidine kinase
MTRKDHGKVQVVISDTGQGMPADVKQRIFEPFFTTKPAGVGTGLGLSVSYGIIQGHNGSISVDSTPNVGTTFTVTLPLSHQPAK